MTTVRPDNVCGKFNKNYEVASGGFPEIPGWLSDPVENLNETALEPLLMWLKI